MDVEVGRWMFEVVWGVLVFRVMPRLACLATFWLWDRGSSGMRRCVCRWEFEDGSCVSSGGKAKQGGSSADGQVSCAR